MSPRTVASRGLPTLLGAWLLSATASAQPVAVDEHLRRGVDLRRAGRDDEAVGEFAEAYRLAPGPRTAAQLALARQALGAWLDADRLLREALSAPSDPWVARNRAALDAALAVVGHHLGSLEVRANVEGADLRVDGRAVARLPMTRPVPVLAGAISVEVAAPGYETASRRFIVDPGALVRESVELRPEASAPEPSPPAPVAPIALGPPAVAPSSVAQVAPVRALAPRPWWRRWAWAPAALGGATLAFAAVAFGLREDAAVQYNHQCPPAPPTDGPCIDVASRAGTWETAAWASTAVGGALLATGLTLLALPEPSRGNAAVLRCAPAGAGVTCALRF